MVFNWSIMTNYMGWKTLALHLTILVSLFFTIWASSIVHRGGGKFGKSFLQWLIIVIVMAIIIFGATFLFSSL